MLRRRSSSSSSRSSCRSVCCCSEGKVHLWRQRGSLRGTADATVAEILEAVWPRQHRAVIARAFVPAVFLARRMRRDAVLDRRLDPLAAHAIRLVGHIGHSLPGQAPREFLRLLPHKNSMCLCRALHRGGIGCAALPAVGSGPRCRRPSCRHRSPASRTSRRCSWRAASRGGRSLIGGAAHAVRRAEVEAGRGVGRDRALLSGGRASHRAWRRRALRSGETSCAD
jgi:hypothetical protein